MLDNKYIYNNIYIPRFLNKFYFIKTKQIPLIILNQLEFHNIKNEHSYINFFSFLEELTGINPFFVKKDFHYNSQGKKIYAKDIRLICYSITIILNIIKLIFINIYKKFNRKLLTKKFGNKTVNLTVLSSSFFFLTYREVFLLINTFNCLFKFNIKNRFLISYFYKNFNFL